MRLPERIQAGDVLAAVGAVVLLVSLFLDWFEPGGGAWTVFEALDLVLAAVAILALVGVVGRFELAGRDRELPVTALAALALVIVVSQLVNQPPGVSDASLEIGAWLALAGAALMAAGGLLVMSGISFEIVFDRPGPERRVPAADARSGTPATAADERTVPLPPEGEPRRPSE